MALIILLVGVASAGEISKDVTDTNSITEEVAIPDTYKISDTANNIQENKIDKNIRTNKASDYIDENTTKTLQKATNNTGNMKTNSPITNWKQLQAAVNNAVGKKT